ncbi:MAG: S41 family peptidase [Coleofasciculaceae cyanobacterium SM2_1_6]|nr:S41 family peptidase [Coleofasciculaceae cyanobacterium SM2_1_6]
MNSSFKFLSRSHLTLLGGTIAAATALTLFVPTSSNSVQAAWSNSPKAIVDEAWQIINRDYVDGNFNQVNWLNVRQELLSRDYSDPEQAYTAIREAVKRLNDPYTRFLDPKQFRDLTDQTAGEVTGIGIRLEQDVITRAIRVINPIENSPAAQVGIRSGDLILAVDGRSTQGMTLEAVSGMIRGRVGSSVKIRISRPGVELIEFDLVRRQIEVPTVHYTLRQEGNVQVGYIRLDEFGSHAAEQMQKAIQTLRDQKAEAFVLDLRGNPGGLLQASVEIAQMWMNNAPVVRTVDRQGTNQEFRANRRSLTDLPLAVLVDGRSASASEILSGALQDNGRATVIGSQTFGKALVQSINPLSDGSGLAVTIAHYYTPNGTDINKKGITPDIKVDLTSEDIRRLSLTPGLIGTIEDPQYQQAVSTLTASINPNARLANQQFRIPINSINN